MQCVKKACENCGQSRIIIVASSKDFDLSLTFDFEEVLLKVVRHNILML